MRLPKLLFSPKRSRQQVIAFGGVNYGEGFSDGELCDSKNICSDLYPCLSVRKSRKKIKKLESPDGIYAGDDLFTVDGGKIYENELLIGTLSAGKKRLVKINTKLCVFPDKVYFNLNDKDNYELTIAEPKTWAESFSEYFTKDGDEYIPVTGESAPQWVPERYYRYTDMHSLSSSFSFLPGTVAFYGNRIKLLAESGYCLRKGELYTFNRCDDYFGGDTAEFGSSNGKVAIKHGNGNGIYLNATDTRKGMFVALRECYNYSPPQVTLEFNGTFIPNSSLINGMGVIEKVLEIHEDSGTASDSDWASFEVRRYDPEEFEYDFKEGFCDLFKPGDGVIISGCSLCEENNLSLVVRSVSPTELVFDSDVFTACNFEVGTVKIERKVPDFECICEYNNRLWGASENNIYASALGDPTNFNLFDGLASDSFTAAVGSDGKFTGCIGYSGSVLFFKEDMMYKVMGDYPANFMINSYDVAGVKSGSEESLVNINERLFYHAIDGVYVYTGSIPTCVSQNFGMRRFEDACAGSCGTKYYISMKDCEKGEYNLFTYDTVRWLWLREDETQALGFAEYNNGLLMLCKNGEVLQTEYGDDNAVSWCAELCEITEYIHERKCYSKLYLRLDMGAEATVKVEMRCDRGEWRTVWESSEETGYTANVVFKPTRCDRFSIRLSGVGKAVVRSLIREYEVGSEV